MKNCNISEYLKKNGIKLYETEYALEKSKALDFLLILEDEGIFILGGDVYLQKNDKFEPLYDNWYSQKDSCSIEKSFDKSREYIKGYKRDGNIFFVIVYE